MSRPQLIGISGKSGTGKSTAADYLVKRHGYTELAFADRLKQVARMMFGFTWQQLYGSGRNYPCHIENLTPRQCLQKLGDFGRRLWPDIWVWHVTQEIRQLQKRGMPVVVSDVRYPNEARELRGMGAVLIRLEWPRNLFSCHDFSHHESEIALDDWDRWDYLFINSGSLTDLQRFIDSIVA